VGSEPEMWVPGETTVLRDAKGFVLPGRDLVDRALLQMKHERAA